MHGQTELQIDCRQKIKEIICLANPASDGIAPQDRPCLDGGEQYAHFFEEIYDVYPQTLQKMFCSLKKIFVENSFTGTAYAGAIYNSQGQPVGAMMGVRRSVLDEKLSLENWASWKEQLSFGGAPDSYTHQDNLPQVKVRIANPPSKDFNDLLYFAIAHEFGHIFDFANGLNFTLHCTPEHPPLGSGDCELAKGTWGSISWIRTTKPNPDNDFINRSGLCFYNCGQSYLSENVIPQIYSNLYLSQFISSYAATQPWDDFADSLAYYVIDKNLHADYSVQTSAKIDAVSYDIMSKLHSDVFASKYNYIENFLNRANIRYP